MKMNLEEEVLQSLLPRLRELESEALRLRQAIREAGIKKAQNIYIPGQEYRTLRGGEQELRDIDDGIAQAEALVKEFTERMAHPLQKAGRPS